MVLKKLKLFKRGFKNLIKKPSILFYEKYQNIELHFDMHHGYGNLKKLLNVMDKCDRNDFLDYVNQINILIHILCLLLKKKLYNEWFEALFNWLRRCEKIFGLTNLKRLRSQLEYMHI